MMKGSAEFLKPGLMTSIQDLGRAGFAQYAVPHSGVMDENAARIALLLLNLPMSFPLIECTYAAPHLLFHSDVRISITGANFNWKLNQDDITPNQVYKVKKGDTLRGGMATDGLRAYIAIEGKIEADKVLASYSTYTRGRMGGIEGRNFQKGDILKWTSISKLHNKFKLRKGPEFDWLDENSKKALTEKAFTVSSDTDRMGMRLDAYKLRAKSYQLQSSAPVLPGFIQLPPSGNPIIVLQDGQTTGGYPRIAYLPRTELSRLNQIKIGGEILFCLIKN